MKNRPAHGVARRTKQKLSNVLIGCLKDSSKGGWYLNGIPREKLCHAVTDTEQHPTAKDYHPSENTDPAFAPSWLYTVLLYLAPLTAAYHAREAKGLITEYLPPQ